MRHKSPWIAVVLSLLAALPATVRAADPPARVVSEAQLDAALAQHGLAADAQRETIQRLLGREQVRRLAAGAGLDLRRAARAVDVLGGPELAQVAARAAAADQALAGGRQTITISVVTLLLIIIIVILLAR